jgi:hypothetical protein
MFPANRFQRQCINEIKLAVEAESYFCSDKNEGISIFLTGHFYKQPERHIKTLCFFVNV